VIAFTSDRDDGEGDIYIMNADGSGERRLTDNPAYDGWPAWSPDGSRITFMSTRSGNPDLYVMDADGQWADDQDRCRWRDPLATHLRRGAV
jgi:Tol biopolymer transport system component